MKEELYVLINNEWKELELQSPSNITFEFKSTLFSDITKVMSSKTYTFTLPATQRNNSVLSVLNDIRSISPVLGKKLPCLYKISGTELMKNAFLYINQIDKKKEYKAVMSWGGVIMEEDLDISELKQGDVYDFRESTPSAYALWSSFNSNEGVLTPLYSCGVPFSLQSSLYRTKSWKAEGSMEEHYVTSRATPLPCISVHDILTEIEKRYNLKFDFNKRYDKQQWEGNVSNGAPDVVNKGVIPIKSLEIDKADIEPYTLNLSNPNVVLKPINTTFMMYHAYLAFKGMSGLEEYMNVVKETCIDTYKVSGLYNMQIKAKHTETAISIGIKLSGEIVVTIKPNTNRKFFKTLRIRRTDNYNEIKTIEATTNGDRVFTYSFKGDDAISMDSADTEGFEFSFGENSDMSADRENFYVESVSGSMTAEPVLDVMDRFVKRPIRPWKLLPEISCKEFVKSLFYIAGGFPVVNENGSIGLVYYNDILKNIISGNIYDWSKYLTNPQDKTIKYSDNTLGIENYYLMKNESVDGREEKTQDEVYERNFAMLRCKNMSLKSKKTIIQMPYNGRFIKDLQSPGIATGDTFRFYKMKDGMLETNEAKPSIGILEKVDNYVFSLKINTTYNMRTWQFPADLEHDERYAYLASIIKNPVYLECKMSLPLYLFKDIDFAKPIYIEAYNSLFVATDIRYSSKNNISTVSMIKLPSMSEATEDNTIFGVLQVTDVYDGDISNISKSATDVPMFKVQVVDVINGNQSKGKYEARIIQGGDIASITRGGEGIDGDTIYMSWQVPSQADGQIAPRYVEIEINNTKDQGKKTRKVLTIATEGNAPEYREPAVSKVVTVPAEGGQDLDIALVVVSNVLNGSSIVSGNFTCEVIEGANFATITSVGTLKSGEYIKASIKENNTNAERYFSIKVKNAEAPTKDVVINVTQSPRGYDLVKSVYVMCFNQSTTPPETPTGGSYDFSNEVLNAPEGWSVDNKSLTGKGDIWMSYTTFWSNGDANEWSKPIRFVDFDGLFAQLEVEMQELYDKMVADADSDLNKLLTNANAKLTEAKNYLDSIKESFSKSGIEESIDKVTIFSSWYDKNVDTITNLAQEVDSFKGSITSFGERIDVINQTVSTVSSTLDTVKAKAETAATWVDTNKDKVSSAISTIDGINATITASVEQKIGEEISTGKLQITPEKISAAIANGNGIGAVIMAAINDESSEVKIQADKIILSGETIVELLNSLRVVINNGASAFEKDGSGHLAQGNISWDASGNAEVKGKITASNGKIGGFVISDTSINNGNNINLCSSGASKIGGLSIDVNGNSFFDGTITASGGIKYNTRGVSTKVIQVMASDDLVFGYYNGDIVFVLPQPTHAIAGKQVTLRTRTRQSLFVVCDTTDALYNDAGKANPIDAYDTGYKSGYMFTGTHCSLICSGSEWFEVSR